MGLDLNIRDLADELYKKYPPDVLQAILTGAIKDGTAGRTITVTIEGGAVKVTVG